MYLEYVGSIRGHSYYLDRSVWENSLNPKPAPRLVMADGFSYPIGKNKGAGMLIDIAIEQEDDKEGRELIARHELASGFSGKVMALRPGESLIHHGAWFMRVPGGWVMEKMGGCCFIPMPKGEAL